MTRLVITRHGQSIANAEHRFAGHSDFDLSELGRQQAELTADYICKNEKIDIIYSSDLLRAYNTAAPTAKRLGMEIIPTTDLREIFAGDWEGKTTDELAVEFEEDFGIWKNDYARARCTGGESIAEVYARTVKTMTELAERHDGKTLLLSTHATVVRSITAHALGFDAEHVGEVSFAHNASVNIFTYEDGRFAPVSLNITEQLGDLATPVPKELRA